MSGRIHDLINAENFAKWAEERGTMTQTDPHPCCGCATAQFLQSLGVREPNVTWFNVSGDGVELLPNIPRWLHRVLAAWSHDQRSGPALAKIARENA
jgi:hypothetical protein